MCKKLIDHGVDPRHQDPFGNTPLDKAKLYNNIEAIKLLEKEMLNAETKSFVNWKDPDRINRSGKWRSFMHY